MTRSQILILMVAYVDMLMLCACVTLCVLKFGKGESRRVGVNRKRVFLVKKCICSWTQAGLLKFKPDSDS